ncbi:hypothetical protein FRC03_008126 [Tulasnella sp. 419]|nr:hypothetical protein FRC03_008126 [Tulasnella sp. 419]
MDPSPTPEAVSLASTFKLPPPNLLTGSVLAALLAVIVYILSQKRATTKKSTVLLVGPSDAGKTAIFSSLAYSSARPTHTSLQPNVALMPSEDSASNPTTIIDIPGHPRIRSQFTTYLQETKTIVFVVDASNITRNGSMVAEHLHLILHSMTSLPPSQKAPKLVIHAHKADLLNRLPSAAARFNATSLARERVKTILERELERRRQSSIKGVGVEGLGSENAHSADDGLMGGLDCTNQAGGISSFKFDAWDGGEVFFTSGWVDVQREDGMHEASEKNDAENSELARLDGLASLKDML